jgi:hypothetical protein
VLLNPAKPEKRAGGENGVDVITYLLATPNQQMRQKGVCPSRSHLVATLISIQTQLCGHHRPLSCVDAPNIFTFGVYCVRHVGIAVRERLSTNVLAYSCQVQANVAWSIAVCALTWLCMRRGSVVGVLSCFRVFVLSWLLEFIRSLFIYFNG